MEDLSSSNRRHVIPLDPANLRTIWAPATVTFGDASSESCPRPRGPVLLINHNLVHVTRRGRIDLRGPAFPLPAAIPVGFLRLVVQENDIGGVGQIDASRGQRLLHGQDSRPWT